MLFGIVWLSRITKPLFTVSHFEVSISDILYFNAGIYLVVSSIKEITVLFKIKKPNNPVQTETPARMNLSDGSVHQPKSKPGIISLEKDSYKSVVVLRCAYYPPKIIKCQIKI